MSRRKPGTGNYEVGYGRPPLATRFQPGRSGNPKRRRKVEKTIGEDLRDALMTKVKVVENGRTKYYTAQQVVIRNVITEAARKNPRAISLLINLVDRYGPSEDSLLDPHALAPDDAAVLRTFLEKATASPDRDSCPPLPADDAPSGDDDAPKLSGGTAPEDGPDE